MINKVLLNDKSSIFYDLAAGKPNPKELRPEKGLDTRSRVLQNRQKGNTCFFYAVKIIRDQTGKCTGAWNEEERKIEKACSNWRKEVTELEKNENYVHFDDCLQKCVPINEKLFKIFNQDAQEIANKSWEIATLDGYKNDPKLASVKENELIQFFQQSKTQLKEQICKLRPSFLALTMREATHRLMAEKYGLQCSKWSPKEKNPLSLVQELKDKGPMTIGGRFGQSFYKEPSFVLKEKINNELLVRGWPVGSRSTTNNMAHTIVLVGAQNNLVYFVDPDEDSNPETSTSRTVYVNSYKTFCENLCSTYGVPTTQNLSSLGYAYFNPKFKLSDYTKK